MKSTVARKLNHEHPERMIRLAVWGMLPKNQARPQTDKEAQNLQLARPIRMRHNSPRTFNLIEKYSLGDTFRCRNNVFMLQAKERPRSRGFGLSPGRV